MHEIYSLVVNTDIINAREANKRGRYFYCIAFCNAILLSDWLKAVVYLEVATNQDTWWALGPTIL